jgi:hypothetical protein
MKLPGSLVHLVSRGLWLMGTDPDQGLVPSATSTAGKFSEGALEIHRGFVPQHMCVQDFHLPLDTFFSYPCQGRVGRLSWV